MSGDTVAQETHSVNLRELPGPRLPGGEGVWVFVCGDLLIFSLFFCVFLDYRSQDIALFAQSASTLNLTYGLLNTLVLLASSWFMVAALKAFRLKQYRQLKAFSWAALICGLLFVLLKVFEYKEKLSLGLGLTTNDFFMFYFVLTGIHLLHVFIGLIIVGWLTFVIEHDKDRLSESIVESACIFWHMVDLLWIVLFPLLYLLP